MRDISDYNLRDTIEATEYDEAKNAYFLSREGKIVEVERCASQVKIEDIQDQFTHITPESSVSEIAKMLTQDDYEELMKRVWKVYWKNYAYRFNFTRNNGEPKRYQFTIDGKLVYDESNGILPFDDEVADYFLMRQYFYSELDFKTVLDTAIIGECPISDILRIRYTEYQGSPYYLWTSRSDAEEFATTMDILLQRTETVFYCFATKKIFHASAFYPDGTPDIGNDAILYGENMFENGILDYYGDFVKKLGIYSNIQVCMDHL